MHINSQQIALTPALGQQLLTWWQAGLNFLGTWQQRHRHREKLRHLLRHLNEAQLRDIGIDIHVARFERDKPFWRA